MQIVFLGTGGGIPSKERNVSAVAVKLGAEVVLFDCGEGTQRQFMQSPLSFMQVSRVFLSHLHGDHFLGLNGLVQTMAFNGRKEPLEVFGPQETAREMGKFLGVGYFAPSFEVRIRDISPGEKLDFGGYAVTACAADHTVPALAYSLEEKPRPGKFNRPEAERLGVPPGPLFSRLQSGQKVTAGGREITPEMVMGPPRRARKIVYTGDTRPCDAIVQLAQGADLLLHDCTLGSPLEEKGNPYGHSSARQAAQAAKDAGAATLVLLHISPRYEETEGLLEEAKAVFPSTVIAQDMMALDVKFRD